MPVQRFSISGTLFVVLYSSFFWYALMETVRLCPDWFCTILLAISVLPWSLIGGFDAQPVNYPLAILLWILNSTVLYFLGRTTEQALKNLLVRRQIDRPKA
ncbi:MAG: hypothetical protein ACEQSB_01055 [Undibacterium sp.]